MAKLVIEDLRHEKKYSQKELRMIRGGVAGSQPRLQYPGYNIPAPGGGGVGILVEGLAEWYITGGSSGPFNWEP